MIITKEKTFRIRVANSKSELRSPFSMKNATFTGCEKNAIKSAIESIETIGEGAAFLVEKWYVPAGMDWCDGYYNGYKGGEYLDGRYYPRNNL